MADGARRRGQSRVATRTPLTVRFTHAYPDGPAPYYTILAPGKRGSQLEQWDEIKRAVSDKLIDLGGTITHHHSVGRDHRPWYDRQRPDGFATALKAVKRSLDPQRDTQPGQRSCSTHEEKGRVVEEHGNYNFF